MKGEVSILITKNLRWGVSDLCACNYMTTETTVFLKASKCLLFLVIITVYILFYYSYNYIYISVSPSFNYYQCYGSENEFPRNNL